MRKYITHFVMNTACGHRMAHRKWSETKQQPSMLPGPAVPGCCLVSFHFLWAILYPQAVHCSKSHFFILSAASSPWPLLPFCHSIHESFRCKWSNTSAGAIGMINGPWTYEFEEEIRAATASTQPWKKEKRTTLADWQPASLSYSTGREYRLSGVLKWCFSLFCDIRPHI